jgi:hypothetical protein
MSAGTGTVVLVMVLFGVLLALFSTAAMDHRLDALETAVGELEQRVERLERAPARHQSTGEGEAISWTR